MIKYLFFLLLIATPAWADTETISQDLPSALPTAPDAKNKWDITFGGGEQIDKTYEGSRRYEFLPVPYFNIIYDETVAIDTEGVDLYLLGSEKAYAGVGLTYDSGRPEDGGNILFSTGQSTLQGLGDIHPSIGTKIFGSVTQRDVELEGDAVKYFGPDNNGTLVNLEISRPVSLLDHWTLTPSLGLTWANSSYMKTYFGITPTQAFHSRFAPFTAHNGIKDIIAGLNVLYKWKTHWFISTDLSAEQLLNDAANSPITESNINPTVTTVVGYHF